MIKLWLHDCPRCKGDRYLEEAFDGPEIICIQCGYRVSVSSELVAEPVPIKKGLERRVAFSSGRGGVAA